MHICTRIALSLVCVPVLGAADVLADQFPKGEGKTRTVEQLQPMLGGSYELDQLAGVAQLMNIVGTEEAFPVLAKTLQKSKVLQLSEVTCLIGTSTRRVEHIKALLSNPGTRSLGAASLAAMAVVEHLFAERYEEFGDVPLEKDGDDNGGKGGKGKGRGKKSDLDDNALKSFTSQIQELLKDKDETVVEYGLVAAAYSGDPTFVADVMGLKAKSGGIPGLKLLYLARTQQKIDPKMVDAAFKSVCRGPQFERESGYMARCQTLVPSCASAAEAIGYLGEKGVTYLQDLHNTLSKEKDIRSQYAAAKAIALVRSEESIPVLLKAMEKCEWPVFVQILNALGKIPSAQSVEPLIDRLGKEKGRFRLDCLYALNSIAGEMTVNGTADDWRGWWKQHKDTFMVDRAKTDEFRTKHRVTGMLAKVIGQFYGARIYSDRLAFVLDSSASMKGDKIANLREQTVEALSPFLQLNHARANIIDFGGKVEIFYPDELTPDIKGMMRYVESEMDLSLGTRSMDAFVAAMKLHGCDTIYFLSDGAPVRSIREAWDDIRRYVVMMNRYRPVAIYCIGYQASVGGYKGMAQLSWEHDGTSERTD